jgi:hypothetical protein
VTNENLFTSPPDEIYWRTVADVAELADAPDSKFHFWCFQGVSLRFKENDKSLGFIGWNTLLPHQRWISIQSAILSQKV